MTRRSDLLSQSWAKGWEFVTAAPGERSNVGIPAACAGFLRLAGRLSMKHKQCGPVEAFLPGIVWRASQCGWLRIGKTAERHDIWEKPNGQTMIIRSGVEPLVPARTRTGTLLRRLDLEERLLVSRPSPFNPVSTRR